MNVTGRRPGVTLECALQARPRPCVATRGQPRVFNEFGQLLERELADVAGPQQHRRVAVEVACGEQRRGLICDQGMFVGF